MYVIGLTGNIASGKSAVLRQLAELGADAIDADRVAHAVMLPGRLAWSSIRAHFGDEVLLPSGEIDRRRLGQIVFADPEELARLEAITHPTVRAEVESQLTESGAAVAAIEAIKLIESGLVDACNALWVVTTSAEVQLERLIRDRGLSVEQAQLHMEAQPPPEPKVAAADVLFDNSSTLADLHAAVSREWQEVDSGTAPQRDDLPRAIRTAGSYRCQEGRHSATLEGAGNTWRLACSTATRLPRLSRPLLAALDSSRAAIQVPAGAGPDQFMRGMGYREVYVDDIQPEHRAYRPAF